MDKNKLYRSIPKVDVLLKMEEIQHLITQYSREEVMDGIRSATEELRQFIEQTEVEAKALEAVGNLCDRVRDLVIKGGEYHMIPVINGTGTILHTNLGRAPISAQHMKQVSAIATGYSNLEYNLTEGKRGERYAHFEELLCKITGAEAAIAVNNNAAAVMLILNALGKGKEVVVSRGELVEVGGKFRIPDVMEISGAKLVEIGTTNKTHYSDYQEAITDQTGVLLKVHTSNYRIVGFTQSVPMEDLVPLGRSHGIPVVEDLGSGVLIDMSKYGITYEPTVQDALRNGADVVCFSGDKLLGGPQAGIIVGKKQYIDQMKRNQLTRALRIDKFTAAALEVVLQEYLSEEKAVRNIPVLQMMTKSFEEVEKAGAVLLQMLQGIEGLGRVRLEPCESQIGGGSLPLERIPSMGIVIKPEGMRTVDMEEKMRQLEVPIICRVINDEILLDVRTIGVDEFDTVVQGLSSLN